MKYLVVVLSLFLTQSLQADQCALIPADVAAKAMTHVSVGDQVAQVCDLCEKFQPEMVDVLSVEIQEKNGFAELFINGKGVDLAYTYIQNNKSLWQNLASLSGCTTTGTPKTIILGGFDQDTSGFAAHYGTDYYLADFWSGEYPAGFSLSKSMNFKGRLTPDKSKAAAVSCTLPAKATIHPWNEDRNSRDKIKFVAAVKKVVLTAKNDFEITPWNETPIKIKKGEKITYLTYLAEGSMLVDVRGREVEADQSLFENVEDVSREVFDQEDQWVRVKCQENVRAYLLLSEIDRDAAGMESPNIGEYGKASDLK